MKHSILEAIIGSEPLGVKNIFEYFALSSTWDEFLIQKGECFWNPKNACHHQFKVYKKIERFLRAHSLIYSFENCF